MGTPKEDPDDEILHENILQRHEPDAGGCGFDIVRGDITLSSSTAEISKEKELQSDSKEQATKSNEKEGLAITAPEKVSTETEQVNPTSRGNSSTSDHFKGPLSTNVEKRSGNIQGDLDNSAPILLQSKEILERGASSVTCIHATGNDSKVDPSEKEAKEECDFLEQRLNHDAKILTTKSCEEKGIVAVKSQAYSDTLPQIQTPNSSSNMIVKFEAGSDSSPKIQTPNAGLPSSQSNQDFTIISEKSLDKLQPRRNPEISIRFTPSPSLTPEKPLEDGFNWRKYGQKLIKGNEFVRSYYRCTYHNCVVKKQVERSYAGQLTDINYIGEHEHPRPQHTPHVGIAVVQPSPMRKTELSVVSSPEGITNIQPLSMRKPELSIVSSPKAEKASASHCGVSQFVESRKAASPPTLDKYSVGGFSRYEVDSTSGPDLKRQKIDISSDDPLLNKHSSEPKQVVQTMSEVDLVSDGYRWRKYGQKLVKGNLNPRSYYRCSNAGCPAKKHIERASHDHKVVITTYEGHHNHEIPFSRAVTQNTSGGRGMSSVITESRSPETGEKANGLEMVVHISASS